MKTWAEKLASNEDLTDDGLLELINDCSSSDELEVTIYEPGDEGYEEMEALFDSLGQTRH